MTCKREAELLAEIEQTGAMYKVSVMQLIKAGSRIAELEALNGALCRDNAGFVQERDKLAAQNQAMHSKVYSATICHPNGVQYLLEEALTLPDKSAEILRARDAQTIRSVIGIIQGGSFLHDKAPAKLFANEVGVMLERIAGELEQKK